MKDELKLFRYKLRKKFAAFIIFTINVNLLWLLTVIGKLNADDTIKFVVSLQIVVVAYFGGQVASDWQEYKNKNNYD